MASIERTAYPRFPRLLTLKDIQTSFTPREDEVEWTTRFARSADSRLALLVQLKCFQYLKHFPAIELIPEEIVEHVSASLGMVPTQSIAYSSATACRALHRCSNTTCGHRLGP